MRRLITIALLAVLGVAMMTGRELSPDCFDDRCRDCESGLCQCRCHEDQEWDFMAGWVDRDDEETTGCGDGEWAAVRAVIDKAGYGETE